MALCNFKKCKELLYKNSPFCQQHFYSIARYMGTRALCHYQIACATKTKYGHSDVAYNKYFEDCKTVSLPGFDYCQEHKCITVSCENGVYDPNGEDDSDYDCLAEEYSFCKSCLKKRGEFNSDSE